MEAPILQLYFLLQIAAWYMCSRHTWRKISLSKSPAVNFENIAVNATMFSLTALFVSGFGTTVQEFLPWFAGCGALVIFYATESNNECFWKKRRNLLYGGTFVGMAIATLQLIAIDSLAISGLFLLLMIRKSQINLGSFYKFQIQDFAGVKEKLLLIETSLRNQSIISNDSDDRPTSNLDIAI